MQPQVVQHFVYIEGKCLGKKGEGGSLPPPPLNSEQYLPSNFIFEAKAVPITSIRIIMMMSLPIRDFPPLTCSESITHLQLYHCYLYGHIIMMIPSVE